jgi:DNA-binding IclR family transcriptional regulator
MSESARSGRIGNGLQSAPPRYSINALDTALSVLESFLTPNADVRKLATIAQESHLNKSRVFRILTTLVKRGYVEHYPQTQEYRLGLRLLVLGDRVRQGLSLWQAANPVMAALAEECGDAVHLLALVGDCAYSIASHYGPNMLQARTPQGVPLPLHIGASPKLLLAHLPEAERDRLLASMELRSYTPNTITSRDELRETLAAIWARGYSIDEQDFELGVYAVGAPVFDHSGQVVAGLSITTPQQRHSPERQQELIRLVVAAAQRISARLGYARAAAGQTV